MASAHFVSTSCLKTALNETEAYIYASVDIVTATLGLLGSLYVILTWKIYYRIRCNVLSCNKQLEARKNITIVFFLAISTLFACIGVLAKSIQLAVTYPSLPSDAEAEPRLSIDIPISILGTFSYIASFMWTFSYALDIHFQLRENPGVSSRSYHVLCWGFAGILTVLQALISYLPPSHHCILSTGRADAKYIAFYCFLVFIMFAVPFFFILNSCKIRQVLRAQGRLTENERVLQATMWKFVFVVLIFVFSWIFNFINGIYLLRMKETQSPFVFYVLEACTNPMPGFFNAFVFGKHEEAKKWFCNRCANDDDDDDETQRLARDFAID